MSNAVCYARKYWPYHLVQAQLLTLVHPSFLHNLEQFELWGRTQQPVHSWFTESWFSVDEIDHLGELVDLLCVVSLNCEYVIYA